MVTPIVDHMISTLAIEGYRSLRDFVVPLDRLTVITGANGSGKSSVYRSLRLLAEASRNGASAALAKEGGLGSTLWAGESTSSSTPISLRLGFASDDFSYAIDFGLPVPSVPSLFVGDPEIKTESVWSGEVLRPASELTNRKNGLVTIRDESGRWVRHEHSLRPFDSMLSELADPRVAPELLTLREAMRSWRFYDHFRTDAAAPARQPHIGTQTPVLHHDGSDLAASIQTIVELGVNGRLDEAVNRAFPGSSLRVANRGGWFELSMHQHGLRRPLTASELSDGTLRYILWVAALLSPRPPAFLVLNEPETSLHPDLIEPLAELIITAADESQIVVVTHSATLITALRAAKSSVIELEKTLGETHPVGQKILDRPLWNWPKR